MLLVLCSEGALEIFECSGGRGLVHGGVSARGGGGTWVLLVLIWVEDGGAGGIEMLAHVSEGPCI